MKQRSQVSSRGWQVREVEEEWGWKDIGLRGPKTGRMEGSQRTQGNYLLDRRKPERQDRHCRCKRDPGWTVVDGKPRCWDFTLTFRGRKPWTWSSLRRLLLLPLKCLYEGSYSKIHRKFPVPSKIFRPVTGVPSWLTEEVYETFRTDIYSVHKTFFSWSDRYKEIRDVIRDLRSSCT